MNKHSKNIRKTRLFHPAVKQHGLSLVITLLLLMVIFIAALAVLTLATHAARYILPALQGKAAIVLVISLAVITTIMVAQRFYPWILSQLAPQEAQDDATVSE